MASFAAVLGLWLAPTPFLIGPDSGLGTDGESIAAIEIAVGIAVFVTGASEILAVHKRRREAGHRPTARYDRRGQ